VTVLVEAGATELGGGAAATTAAGPTGLADGTVEEVLLDAGAAGAGGAGAEVGGGAGGALDDIDAHIAWAAARAARVSDELQAFWTQGADAASMACSLADWHWHSMSLVLQLLADATAAATQL